MSDTVTSPFVSPPSTILVTGANGYIASHTVSQLLSKGYKVIGTVRSSSKRKHVLSTHASHGQLSVIVVEDISRASCYMDAIAQLGGEAPSAILHLAAPFSYAVSSFESDLLIPAVKGSQAILEVAQKLGVKRVVHTNSFASIYDAALGPRPGYVYTEKDWSPLTYQDGINAPNAPTAYRAAKTVAEKSAWDFIKANQDKGGLSFDLVSLCPAMVFGPYVNAEAVPGSSSELGESVKIVWDVVTAGAGADVPLTKGPVWVDVVDVAVAHVRALEVEEAGGERYLLAAGVYCNQEIADSVRELGLGKELVPVGTPGKRESGAHFGVDAGKAERSLGIRWTTMEESMRGLVPQLLGIERK
ncbi:NAD(P)-binding protein [Pleomassaria siparia CBS 279.74]|uniref:NAD(P)-binding protein n=1 Tax=Pleomassaria siparia CBS 279.74 TaxID=1314801 RepID=A0A6G1JTE4_9PLEO|nr:NAD(P)-binding protein [Pleomassaria siparia CBS 279.74]